TTLPLAKPSSAWVLLPPWPKLEPPPGRDSPAALKLDNTAPCPEWSGAAPLDCADIPRSRRSFANGFQCPPSASGRVLRRPAAGVVLEGRCKAWPWLLRRRPSGSFVTR